MSATASSINYPIENVTHRFMKKRFQSLLSNSTITCIFNTVKEINCIFYGYHTLNSFNYTLYDSSNNVLLTGSDTQLLDIGVIYFNKVVNVKKIIISCTAIDNLFIGVLWAGVYDQMNLPMNNLEVNIDDQTVVKSSPDFQFSQLYNESGLEFLITIPTLDNDQKNYLNNTYIQKGKGSPLFIDFYEDNRPYQEPKYVVFSDKINLVRKGIEFEATIKLKEAR
jgi:hypothetical protein